MASPTLSVLSSTHFPQIFDTTLDREIRRVTAIYDHYMPVCQVESPYADFACGQKATIVDLASEQPMCVKCFEQVNR